mgnify:CR=1 FL=1
MKSLRGGRSLVLTFVEEPEGRGGKSGSEAVTPAHSRSPLTATGRMKYEGGTMKWLALLTLPLLLVVGCDQQLKQERYWFNVGFDSMLEYARNGRNPSQLADRAIQAIRRQAKDQTELLHLLKAYEAGGKVVADLHDYRVDLMYRVANTWQQYGMYKKSAEARELARDGQKVFREELRDDTLMLRLKAVHWKQYLVDRKFR